MIRYWQMSYRHCCCCCCCCRCCCCCLQPPGARSSCCCRCCCLPSTESLIWRRSWGCRDCTRRTYIYFLNVIFFSRRYVAKCSATPHSLSKMDHKSEQIVGSRPLDRYRVTKTCLVDKCIVLRLLFFF